MRISDCSSDVCSSDLIVGRTFDLEEYAGLDALERADSGNFHWIVGAEPLELHLLLEPIARNICTDLRDHCLDGRLDLGLFAARRQSEYSITHQFRRPRGVENFDSLSLSCATHLLNAHTRKRKS